MSYVNYVNYMTIFMNALKSYKRFNYNFFAVYKDGFETSKNM